MKFHLNKQFGFGREELLVLKCSMEKQRCADIAQMIMNRAFISTFCYCPGTGRQELSRPGAYSIAT